MDDYEAIRRLIALYAQLLDGRRLEEWGQLFMEDARFRIPGQTFEGRTAIVKGIGGMQPPTPVKHVVLQPVIDLEGDSAKAWTDFSAFATDTEGHASIATIGRYYDELVREEGRWHFRNRTIVFDGDPAPEGVFSSPSR